jgi:hypothetical protein
MAYDSLDKLEAPFCIVEHLMKKTIFIKCGQVDTTGTVRTATYKLIGFHVVVVGPTLSLK